MILQEMHRSYFYGNKTSWFFTSDAPLNYRCKLWPCQDVPTNPFGESQPKKIVSHSLLVALEGHLGRPSLYRHKGNPSVGS